MAFPLVNLPPDLIGLILGYDDTSYLSLQLYLVGDSSLHLLLERGVSYIELRDSKPYSPACLPKYLTKMRSLRHLIVIRVGYCLYDTGRTLEVVRGLPEAMESIIFRFPNPCGIFSVGSSHICVKDTFPQLRTLILDDISFDTVISPDNVTTVASLAELPLSITDLQIRLPTDLGVDGVRAVMQALPPSLVRLSVTSQHDLNLPAATFFPLLPPHLVHFGLYIASQHNHLLGAHDRFAAHHLALLPRSLASVIYQRRHRVHIPMGRSSLNTESTDPQRFTVTWTRGCGASIPPFISSIHLTCNEEGDKVFNELPVHLESLWILHARTVEAKHINTLPPRLTSLQVGRLLVSKKMVFPPALRRLVAMVDEKPFDAKASAALPPLTEVSLMGPTCVGNISLLPRTVTWLRVHVSDLKKKVAWPPHLRTLGLAGTHLTTFGRKDPKKGKIVPLDPALSRNSSGFPTRQPPDSIVLQTLQLSTLPRSLTDIHFHSFAILPSELLHLPPFLTRLHIDYVLDGEVPNASREPVLALARDILRADPESEPYDFCLLGKPQVTICDLLPRSLTHLSYHGFADFPPIVWSRLPRKLVTLQITTSEPIHEDSLLHIPKKHLKSLNTSVSGAIRDDHMQSMPTTMTNLYLHSPTPSSLSANAAAKAPLTTVIAAPNILGASPFTTAMEQRIGELTDAMLACDINKLKRLLEGQRGDL